jgi:peptidoglycan/xylan/chitin deacetylase (PgdA/CDA1 family)
MDDAMSSTLLSFIIVGLIGTSCNSGTTATQQDTSQTKTTDTAAAATSANKFDRQPFVYDTTKQYIYLSFDDGPQPGTTNCMEVCRKQEVKATFFMVGVHGKDKWGKALVTKVRDSYPEFLLANHSNTHAFYNKFKTFYGQPTLALVDFQKAQDSLHVPYKIARLPGNNGWGTATAFYGTKLVKPTIKILDSAGYDVVGWDIEWHFRYDGSNRPVQSAQTIVKQITSALNRKETRTKNHVVLLAHDRMFKHQEDADSLNYVISELKKNPNYVFETVDHYPNLKMKQ